MENKTNIIVSLAVALLLAGILLPLGLQDLTSYDGTYTNSSGSIVGTNATIGNLVGTVLPIMIVIGIVLSLVALVSKKRGGAN
jgi:uncharacterized membrane protein YphA (DoxX/SURF4 family)